jgi:hypothetical protein
VGGGALTLFLVVAGSALIVFRRHQPVDPARLEHTQLTNFAESATSPALSPDGRMLTFIRGTETFAGRGEIRMASQFNSPVMAVIK